MLQIRGVIQELLNLLVRETRGLLAAESDAHFLQVRLQLLVLADVDVLADGYDGPQHRVVGPGRGRLVFRRVLLEVRQDDVLADGRRVPRRLPFGEDLVGVFVAPFRFVREHVFRDFRGRRFFEVSWGGGYENNRDDNVVVAIFW